MSSRLVMAVMGVGILALTVGLFVPTLIDTQATDERDAATLYEGDNVTYEELVKVEVDVIDGPNETVNLTVTDLHTLNQSNITELPEGQSETVNPAGSGEVTIENRDITKNTDWHTTLATSFPHTYGWNASAKVFVTQFDTMFVLVGFIALLGGVGAVLRP